MSNPKTLRQIVARVLDEFERLDRKLDDLAARVDGMEKPPTDKKECWCETRQVGEGILGGLIFHTEECDAMYIKTHGVLRR